MEQIIEFREKEIRPLKDKLKSYQDVLAAFERLECKVKVVDGVVAVEIEVPSELQVVEGNLPVDTVVLEPGWRVEVETVEEGMVTVRVIDEGWQVEGVYALTSEKMS